MGWKNTSVHPKLTTNSVHVWRSVIDQPSSSLRTLEKTLGPNESARAKVIQSASERRRFIAAHGILRSIIGRYVGLPPRDVSFTYGLWEKPMLWSRGGVALGFNMSHTDGLAIMAFTLERQVGVDLERATRKCEIDQLAERFFSTHEKHSMLEHGSEGKRLAFYRIWTCKEALAKASGEGLARLFKGNNVLYRRGDSLRLRAAGHDVRKMSWSIVQFEPTSDYVSALAVEGSVGRIIGLNWRGASV
ncbi:MAG TPA: 4'-phosphopantetheinyl transferase superfamily protein [Nitrososphaerales archaeon]|nr:4'-phosphopantetheinyl transferase superfamily protein [Nitrososphaerales archaeon]